MGEYKILKRQVFTDGAFSIVPVRYEDRLDIMKWRNEQIYHLRQARPLTEADQENYFNNVVARLFDQQLPGQVLFSYLENGRCIGYGGLVHINWIDKNAEISFLINTELEDQHFHRHWGIYLGLIEQVAFGEMGLHKLYTYAFDLRPHLYEAIERKGYIREAVLKEHCLFDGTYKDVVIHSKINRSVRMRSVTPEDVQITYEWTNDEQTRKNSFSSEEIPLSTHRNWLLNKLQSPDAVYYMFEVDGVPAAIVRFDKDKANGTFTIGINIAPAQRGKKLADKFLKQACAAFFAERDDQVDAYIKKENAPSIRSFERAGFKYAEELEINGYAALKYKLNKDE